MFPKPLTRVIIYTPKESARKIILTLANECYVQLNSSFNDKIISEKAKPLQPSNLLARAVNILQRMENIMKEKVSLEVKFDESQLKLGEEDISYFEKITEDFSKGLGD